MIRYSNENEASRRSEEPRGGKGGGERGGGGIRRGTSEWQLWGEGEGSRGTRVGLPRLVFLVHFLPDLMNGTGLTPNIRSSWQPLESESEMSKYCASVLNSGILEKLIS